VLEHGYTVEEVDAIAGPLIGRPKTAAFRLRDLVGLDVAASVARNLYDLIPDDESREVLKSPRVEALRKAQMDKGRLGDKTGQGFYKKDKKSIQTLDLNTGEYRERTEPDIPSLADASKIKDLPKRLRFVLQQDDKAGKLARHIVYGDLGYASRRVPEISDDLVSIDRAVRWGFSHDLGPFELWTHSAYAKRRTRWKRTASRSHRGCARCSHRARSRSIATASSTTRSRRRTGVSRAIRSSSCCAKATSSARTKGRA
jgi:3-hydroxyacyl-CoA dehydrogenase